MAIENDENKGGEGESTIAELKTQIDNLNQGIGKYREEAQSSTKAAQEAAKAATDALAKLAEFEKLNKKEEKGVTLSDDEEKKFAEFAKKNGIVAKSDLDAERLRLFQENVKAVENQAVAEFLEQNPEFDNEAEWPKVMAEFALYKQPTTLQGYKAILNKIRSELSGDAKQEATAKAKAEIINRSKLGLGAGGSRASGDDVDSKIEEYARKYPNLSRDMIIQQLTDIQAIPARTIRK